MAFPFVDAFSQGPSPIQDDAIRDRLQQAILDHDSRSFRETLLAAHPELAGQHRLYGVFAMTPDGMVPIMVDETGERAAGRATSSPEGPPLICSMSRSRIQK